MGVLFILAMGLPAEVREPVVELITILVVRFVPSGAWANEGRQDEAVDLMLLWERIPSSWREINRPIALRSR